MTVVEYIKKNLPLAVRHNSEDKDTLIGLPNPYSIPSVADKFQEMYYWDTYFTNRGLLAYGEIQQAKNNVDNMCYLIEKFGFMPNGNRTYYLYNSQSIAFMVKRYTRHQTLQGVDLSELNMEGYMKFCMVTNEFEATIFHVERPLEMFDPFVYCYFTDANDKYGYMMIVMCDEDYFYNINLSTTYEDFQESKQLLMEYAITIKIG